MSNTQPPQTLKGFRDFLPAEKRKRDYVANVIREAAQLYGFDSLETPTLEYASLLLGKYGDEADKLVYTFDDRGDRKIGLRYDQTVPTARVLYQYQSLLPKYFRRYQIQNVFRADKPQKGRFREFTQADIDIFGSTSPLADAEILATAYAMFKAIGFKEIKIKINDRQTLMATLEPLATAEVSVFSIIQSIDKLDKMLGEDVVAELVTKGLTKPMAQQALQRLVLCQPSSTLKDIMTYAETLGIPQGVLVYESALARGLDYYTGMIFEVSVPKYGAGSCAGGGRYDNLIEDLSGFKMPAVGVALGFDRVVEAADQLGLIPVSASASQVLIAIFDETTLPQTLDTARQLRQAGIATEIVPAPDKLNKQFKIADQKQIPYVILIGSNEAAKNQVSLRNMKTGEQQELNVAEVIAQVSNSVTR